MSTNVRIHRDPSAVPDHWTDERTVAVVLGGEGEEVVVLDLGAPDPALRFVAVSEGGPSGVAPLMRAAAEVAREGGGTVLRWIEEADGDVSPTARELGLTGGEEVYRWWRLGLSDADAGAGREAAPEPAPQGAHFEVEIDGDRAVLSHDRAEEGTPEQLIPLLSAALSGLPATHPGLRTAEAYAAPDDDSLTGAFRALGFVPTERRAVEYALPLAS
ncbi:hypothetical protein [Streptomyces sp. I05A-00742]|uniref:hypothetical protein n=1 Tax=Streptomyces sp. I05A-00742 TaxID=2732853 RepID=UPI0014886CEB|nr:hypothetical protein [Streptomyces sp. I05A-00742]